MNYPITIPSKLIHPFHLLKATPIEKGRHYQSVYILELSHSEPYLLKVKRIEDSGSLLDEADRLRWVQGILPAPQVMGYEVENGNEYLMMTFIEGNTAGDYSQEEGQRSMGFLLGEGLRAIHNVPIQHCPFRDFLPDNLIDSIKVNIAESEQEVRDAINRSFPNQTLEQLIDFVERYKAPMDELVFTHGDYGSENVIIHQGRIAAFIDLGGAGISDPYYDIYYLIKSLTYYSNRKEEVGAFMEGYGIAALDANRMKFHQIIDVLLL